MSYLTVTDFEIALSLNIYGDVHMYTYKSHVLFYIISTCHIMYTFVYCANLINAHGIHVKYM